MAKTEDKKSLADYKPSDEDKKVIQRWQKRFGVAERYRKPYEAKVLRMHKLKRAYRDPLKYPYMTRLMPPIGFRVIQTIATRLEAAKMTVSIMPNDKKYQEDSEAIKDWEKLIAYNLQENNWEDIKNDYIDNQQTEGNAYAQIVWDATINGPKIVIRDWYLTYFDPNAGPRLENSEWEIVRSYKTRARILKDEKKRKGNKIYKNLEFIEDKKIADDPRREREELETLKMGQVRTARNIDNDKDDLRDRQTGVVDDDIKQVEIRECYDHITDEILVFMNDGQVLVRKEKNPYADIDEGQMIVDLPCIRIPHRAYAMAQLEPVETSIIEITDSRNQVSDDVIFNLDPIRKIKKGTGVEKQDLTVGPGEKWVLNNVDDIVLERGVGLDRSWIDKDNMLNDEIDKTLALPEYTSGVPNSSQEPSSKVEALLGQTQIRLGKFLRHYETAMSDIVNKMIQLNQKMLAEVKEEGEEKSVRGRSYRLIKDGKVSFEEFKSVDIGVDAKVRFDLKEEKTPDKRKEEAWTIYDKFILEDRPQPTDIEAMNIWYKERAVVRKIVLKEYDKEQYTDLLTKMQQKEDEALEKQQQQPAVGPAEPPAEAPQLPTPPPEKIPLLPQEPQAESPGFLQKLLGRVRG